MRRALGAIDSRIGRAPMVRLVWICLLALAVAALALSLAGVLQLPPAALLASLAVTVGVSWAGDRAMASIARATPFGESAIVTGLILFLVIFPVLTPQALLLAAATALAANATKYLVRVGGRHLLNPAAAGLFLIGLTGQQGSAWWVATPRLLPLLLVVVVVIAVRIRLVGPVLLLVGLGGALQVAAVVSGGSALGEALSLLPSTPLLFLAGVMFTEPITLPHRRWQRYAEAGLVAVLLVVPYVLSFTVLTLRPTPELALLVGNVFAAIVARPAAAGLRFAGSRRLTPTAVEYAFRPERPLPHRAGQYLELQLPHRSPDVKGVRRSLTIVSAPGGDDGTVRVAVRHRSPASTFKRALEESPVGGPARAITVTGGFTLPKDRGVPLLLIAGGIGITPFVSQLRHDASEVAAGAAPRDVLLVDRVPAADEIPYLPELVATGVRVLLVCPDPAALPALPEHWHVSAVFDAAALAAVLPEPGRRIAYVSGSPRFIQSAKRVLAAVGIRRVRTDAFSGY